MQLLVIGPSWENGPAVLGLWESPHPPKISISTTEAVRFQRVKRCERLSDVCFQCGGFLFFEVA